MKKRSMEGLPRIAVCLGSGALAGLIMTAAVCAAGAWLIGTQKLDPSAAGYCAWLAVALGAISAALVSGFAWREKWWLMCLSSGAVYFVCLLCCTALFFGGQYQGVGVGICMSLGASGACALLAFTSKRGSARRRYGVKIKRFV